MSESSSSGGYISITGDFNADGLPDLALLNSGFSGSVTILLGNGDGTFTESNGSPYAAGYEPQSLAVGDFNGDGRLDIAVANFYNSKVSILIGNGDGTFAAATNNSVNGNGPYAIAVGDFNGDGVPDLIVANDPDTLNSCQPASNCPYSPSVTILTGNGSGSFLSNSPISVGIGPQSVVVGDFNGDGIPDVAVGTYGDAVGSGDKPNSIAIFQNNTGTTAAATFTGLLPVGSGTHNIVASYSGDSNFTGSTSAPALLNTVVNAISAVSPVAGPAGTPITITGAGFGSTQGSSNITVGGVTAAISAWNDPQIQAQIPNGSGPGPQSVLVSVGGAAGVGATFTVTPMITGLSPISGYPNTFVTISGTNFGPLVSGGSSVSFNFLPLGTRPIPQL